MKSLSEDSFEIIDFPRQEKETEICNATDSSNSVHSDPSSESHNNLGVEDVRSADVENEFTDNDSGVMINPLQPCGHILCTCTKEDESINEIVEIFVPSNMKTENNPPIIEDPCICSSRLEENNQSGLILDVNLLTKQKPTCVHCSPDLSTSRKKLNLNFLAKNSSQSLDSEAPASDCETEMNEAYLEDIHCENLSGKTSDKFPSQTSKSDSLISDKHFTVSKRKGADLKLDLNINVSSVEGVNQSNYVSKETKQSNQINDQSKENKSDVYISLPTPVCRRSQPLTEEDFEKLLDHDGRLVDEHALRKAVFMGGVDPSIRKRVWQFLFGLYPCSSTSREREELLLDYIMKYHEQTSRWKTMLVLNAKPGASLLQQGLVARYQIEDSNNTLRSPDDSPEGALSEFEIMERSLMDGRKMSMKPDFNALSKNFKSIDITSPEMQQKMDFMKIQSQVYVNRQKVNTKDLWKHMRVIDKDVPRTDRDLDYFKGAMNQNLTVLRNVLITFAAFHPQIGYAQGMNDILAQFLVVFDSEVEAYWCFSNYMEKIQHEFTEHGMVNKIGLVALLLQEMDAPLFEHLKANELGDLLFCHRWLLLGFKREFTFMDSLICFEILSSHHLELSSMEADKARRNELRKEYENISGVQRTTAPADSESEYTFELFMCIALLQEVRDKLMECTDTAMVFSIINNIKIDLDDILLKAADLFYMYCKKSVEESFLMVDSPRPVQLKASGKR